MYFWVDFGSNSPPTALFAVRSDQIPFLVGSMIGTQLDNRLVELGSWGRERRPNVGLVCHQQMLSRCFSTVRPVSVCYKLVQ